MVIGLPEVYDLAYRVTLLLVSQVTTSRAEMVTNQLQVLRRLKRNMRLFQKNLGSAGKNADAYLRMF
jgi:hypothetical protein